MPHLPIAENRHPAGLAGVEAAPGLTFEHVEEVAKEAHAPPVDRANALVVRTQPP